MTTCIFTLRQRCCLIGIHSQTLPQMENKARKRCLWKPCFLSTPKYMNRLTLQCQLWLLLQWCKVQERFLFNLCNLQASQPIVILKWSVSQEQQFPVTSKTFAGEIGARWCDIIIMLGSFTIKQRTECETWNCSPFSELPLIRMLLSKHFAKMDWTGCEVMF